MPRTRPPRITRTHACALLLHGDAEMATARRTVLAVDIHGHVRSVVPDDVFAGDVRHVVLTRGELLDAGVRVVPRSGGRLNPGSGPRLDAVLDGVNTHLAEIWSPEGTCPSRP
ncbi:hypothetical protein PS9374_04474 [Planomonospora sphaerica]|uniref:Uncharacterized protein n=1 Tax=Planomonospora sphaerica TaxID=161355 RepID=A0A171DIV9_9ACTN|nr:hypothetical protein [Planomonospora sphaerica]GAT68809.1 hypothetical protein PS9374_04474 [Planomonospora sphaerica]